MQRFFLIILILGGFSSTAQNNSSSAIGKLLGKSLTRNNPQARLEFEKLRTRDPETGRVPYGIHEAELQYYHRQLHKTGSKARILENLNNWRNRGPYNVGGRTRALAIDISDESVILAGGVSGGMWRSQDKGETWIKTTGSNDLQSVTAVAQDPRPGQTNTWYYATGEYSGNSASATDAFYYGNGIFKSIDGGRSWTPLPSTTEGAIDEFDQCFDINHELAVSPADGAIFVANYCGIFVSTDGGASFSQVYENPGDGGWSDVVIDSAGVAYAFIKQTGVIRSADNGQKWTNISSASFPGFGLNARGELAIAPSNQNVLYLLAEAATPSGHTLWKYNAETDVWDNRTDGIPAFGGYTGDFDSQAGYDLLIKVKPDNENFVVIGGINLFRSTNGFLTSNNTIWIGGYTPLNNSFGLYANHHPDQHALVFFPSNPNQAVSGNDGGIHLTEDIRSNFSEIVPVTWMPLNNGYLTTQVYAVSAGPGKQILAGFQDNGTWLTIDDDPQANWTLPLGGDGAYNAFSSDGTTRYMSSQFGNIYRIEFSSPEDPTPDNYISFTPNNYETELFVAPFYLDPMDDNLFYLGGAASLYVNTMAQNGNRNTGWKTITLNGATGLISELGVIGNGDVYAGTSTGQVFKVSNTSTTPIVTNLSDPLFAGSYISGIGVNSHDPDEILLSVSNYDVVSIFHSQDGGKSWSAVAGNLEENVNGMGSGPSVRVVRIFGDGALYLAGTSVGLFTTDELNGNHTEWVQEDMANLGAVVVEHLDVRATDGQILVGTHGNGVFSTNLPQAAADLVLTAIHSPVSGASPGSEDIAISIENLGYEAQDGFTLSYAINQEVQETVEPDATIGPGEVYHYVFENAYDFTLGEYEISARVIVENDANPDNNLLTRTISKLALLATFPYQESFETDDHGWQADELWELGIPAQEKVNGASDGVSAWSTNPDANYPNNTTAMLQSPVFDFSELKNPFVTLDISYSIEDTWDGALLAYRTDLNTNDFEFVPLQRGISYWYNNISQAIGNSAWTGNSDGYLPATADLSFLAGEPEVQLALVFVSDEAVTDEGIAMDNFRIYESEFMLSNQSVPEEQPFGTLVGTFTGSTEYELVPGAGDDDNDRFTIEGNELKTAEVFDFETQKKYYIRVAAANQSGIIYEITITDENEAPQNLTLSHTAIPLDADTGEVIGEFSAEDINDDVIRFSLVDGEGADDNFRFSISGDQLLTGEGLQINDTSEQYLIRVEAADASGAFTIEPFVLTVEEILGLISLAKSGVSIFPNPVNDILHLKIHNQQYGDMCMTLYSAGGQEVFHHTWHKPTERTKERVDLSGLAPGTYIIHFDLAGKRVTGRLVKRPH